MKHRPAVVRNIEPRWKIGFIPVRQEPGTRDGDGSRGDEDISTSSSEDSGSSSSSSDE